MITLPGLVVAEAEAIAASQEVHRLLVYADEAIEITVQYGRRYVVFTPAARSVMNSLVSRSVGAAIIGSEAALTGTAVPLVSAPLSSWVYGVTGLAFTIAMLVQMATRDHPIPRHPDNFLFPCALDNWKEGRGMISIRRLWPDLIDFENIQDNKLFVALNLLSPKGQDLAWGYRRLWQRWLSILGEQMSVSRKKSPDVAARYRRKRNSLRN